MRVRPFLRPVSAAVIGVSMLAGPASAAEAFSIDLNGRLQADVSRFDGVYTNDGSAENAAYFRRAYVELAATAYEDWAFVFNYDLSHNEGSEEDGYIHEASVAYRGLSGLELRLGRFEPDFGLEKATSSKWVTALERYPGYDIAGWVNDHDNGLGLEAVATPVRAVYLSGGLYRKEGNAEGDHVDQANARVVFAPRHEAGDVLHVGLSLAWRELDELDGADVRYRSRLGMRGVDTRGGHDADDNGHYPLLGGNDDAARGTWDQDRAWSLEAAWARGPLSLQGEYLRRITRADAADTADLRGQAWYMQVAWTLTGEPRGYELGEFGQVKPNNARFGAWEVFYRYDQLSVEDDNLAVASDTRLPGTAHARVHNLGVNWYASESVRLGAMYVRARLERVTNEAGEDRGDGLVVRAQYVF